MMQVVESARACHAHLQTTEAAKPTATAAAETLRSCVGAPADGPARVEVNGLHSLLQVGHQHIARSCRLVRSADRRAARRRATGCNVQHLQGANAAALKPMIV